MNNIIYNAPNGKTFTWNGATLDEVDNHASFLGSNVFKDEDLEKEMHKAQHAAKLLFPKDSNPNVRYAKLPM
jgi:hypothetical protein